MPLFRRMLKSCQELECGRELPSISPCQKLGHEEVQTIYLWRCSDFGSTTYHVTSMRSIKVHRFWGIPVGSQSSKRAPFPTDHRQTSGIYPENGNVSWVIYIYILYCIINIRTYIIIYYRIPQNMGHPNPKSTQLSSHTAGFKCSLHVARVIPCAGNGFNIRQPIKESGSTSWLILFRHVQAVLCFFDGRCRSNSFFKGIIVRSCAKLSSGLDPNGPKPSLFNLGLSKCWVPPWLLGLSENVNVHPQKPLADDHFPFRQ